MDSTDLLGLCRAELNDAIQPYMLTDDQLYSYIDDAQTMFCRLTDGIGDATTPYDASGLPIALLPIVAGTE